MYQKVDAKSIRKNIFTCVFSIHNTIRLTCHEQVCLRRLRFFIFHIYIYIYIYIYISYIIHSQIKKDYHQVAESIMVPGNKTNPKKIKKKKKKIQIMELATTINTEYTDLKLV